MLAAVLDSPEIFFDSRFVREDLLTLRRSFANDDEGYAAALEQTALELARALRKPQTHGDDFQHDLAGWRRSKYPAIRGGEAEMRLVFRVRENGFDLLVFAHRRGADPDGRPTTAYHRGVQRL